MNEMANGPIKIEMRARQTLDEETSVLPPSWQETMAPVRKRIGARGLAFLLISVVPTLLFAAYLWMFAADQYVSEFRFTVQHSVPVIATDSARGGGAGSAAGANAAIALAVAESESAVGYIKSRQVLDDLADSVDLRKIYANPAADWFWRMDADAPTEERLRYWRWMVRPVFDLTSGIVSVEVRTFAPEDAERVAKAVQTATEKMVNQVSDRSRHDAETYARTLVNEAEQRLRRAEEKLRDFRNSNTVLTPELSATMASKLETELRNQIADVQTRIELFRLQGVKDDAPRLVVLKNQLATLKQQLDRQIGSVTRTAGGATAGQRPLASAISDYDALETERRIATAYYQGTIEALAMARTRAEQQGVYLATFVKPARPDSSVFPQRGRWLGIFFAVSVFTWALAMLFGYSVRDHLG